MYEILITYFFANNCILGKFYGSARGNETIMQEKVSESKGTLVKARNMMTDIFC